MYNAAQLWIRDDSDFFHEELKSSQPLFENADTLLTSSLHLISFGVAQDDFLRIQAGESSWDSGCLRGSTHVEKLFG